MSSIKHRWCTIDPAKKKSWEVLMKWLDEGCAIVWTDIVDGVFYMILAKEEA